MKVISLLALSLILISSCKKTEISAYNPDFINTWNGNDGNSSYYIKIESNGQGTWEKISGFSNAYATGPTYEKKGQLKIGPKKLSIDSEPALVSTVVGFTTQEQYEMTIDGIKYTAW